MCRVLPLCNKEENKKQFLLACISFKKQDKLVKVWLPMGRIEYHLDFQII